MERTIASVSEYATLGLSRYPCPKEAKDRQFLFFYFGPWVQIIAPPTCTRPCEGERQTCMSGGNTQASGKVQPSSAFRARVGSSMLVPSPTFLASCSAPVLTLVFCSFRCRPTPTLTIRLPLSYTVPEFPSLHHCDKITA